MKSKELELALEELRAYYIINKSSLEDFIRYWSVNNDYGHSFQTAKLITLSDNKVIFEFPDNSGAELLYNRIKNPIDIFRIMKIFSDKNEKED